MASQKDNSSRCAGIVLCGGQSSRMGRAKADLPFGDETMLQRTVRIVSQVVDVVVIVAAAEQPMPEFPAGKQVVVARDELEFAGPLAGIGQGLAVIAALPEEYLAAYVTSCDVPWLRTQFIQHLFDQLQSATQPVDVVVPKDEKYFHPLAAVYRVSVLEPVQRLIADGQRRPRMLFDDVETLRLATKSLEHVDPDLRSLMNVNTPTEYRAALLAGGFTIPPWLAESE